MSTYSSNLKIELIGTGEQSGVWGTTTNSNFSNVFEQSIVGRVTVSFSNADVTLTATNTVASQDYRNVYLNCTGTNAASRNLIVPTLNKNYVVENNTTGGFSIVVKTSAGTGITIPNGSKCAVYVDGTNVVQNSNYFPAAIFASITDSALTSGRVVYSTTAGLLTDSANLLYSGTDLTVYGITVGRGVGAISTNTAVGNAAFAATNTGAYQTALGFEAGKATTSGSQNTFVGAANGQKNTTGNYNAALGAFTLYENTTGSYNTALGFNSFEKNTTGQTNTAVGAQSLYSNTTASNATAVGYQAGYSQTTANSTYPNTYVGYTAGRTNITGLANTAVGGSALYANTGDNNTGIGWGSLNANSSGTLNTALGSFSLYSTTTGVSNTGIGQGAGYTNTTGSYNTTIGNSALYSNTTASSNTAVGFQAGYNNTTGINNVHLGYLAGYSNTTNSYNTFIGTQAGQSTTGAQNTFVGINAGYLVTSGAKNTIIGGYSGSAAPISATGSNYIVLSDGDGNVRQTIDSSGNVGIGTSSPTQKLDVNGNIKISSSNGGIIFNNSSALNNSTLNDYETGTCTITDQSGAGLSLTSNTATYTKIGRSVLVQGAFVYPVTANASSVVLGGLPFATSTTGSGTSVYSTSLAQYFFRANNGTSNFIPVNISNTQPTNANLSNATVIFWFTYQTSF